MTRIIALDPGGTTGWVVHDLEDGKPSLPLKVSGGQLGPDLHHKELYDLLQITFEDSLIDGIDKLQVVCEAFTYRIVRSGGTKMPGINLISKEYIGVARLWVQQRSLAYRPAWYEPMPSVAVGKDPWWNKERLKKLGVYTKGEPHRNDATRHLLTHIVGTLKRRDYLWGLHPNRG